MSESTAQPGRDGSPSLPPVAADPEVCAIVERMRAICPKADPLGELPDVHPARIPRHIAIIMDGNGRWAAERGFPRIFGHRNGAAAVRETVEACGRLGVEALTLFSFSSENWKRPTEEVDALMELCTMYCDANRDALVREGVRVRAIGRIDELPGLTRDAIRRVEEATREVHGPTLCLALNYGSRAEIVDAVRAIAREVLNGAISPSAIDDSVISRHLSTAGLPDPDLVIRTAGEMRVSNFLLWQMSYAELYVSPTFWPDFGREELHRAIRAYARRDRRFGALTQSP